MNAGSSGADAQVGRDACVGRSRFWIVPVTAVAILVVLASGLLALTWTGRISPPSVGGAAPPFWFLFPLGFLSFWILILVVARPWGWSRPRGWDRGWPTDPDAVEVVRIRFARGEISRAQMDDLLRGLAETPRHLAGADRR